MQNVTVDYYANVDRLRSVNKLTTLDNSIGSIGRSGVPS
jgi:hypothetical protein